MRLLRHFIPRKDDVLGFKYWVDCAKACPVPVHAFAGMTKSEG